MNIKFYILFIVFLGGQFAFSQSNIEFNELSGDNISTQSITYAVKQDSIGNIWVASEEGVMKYNSKQIKIYNTYEGLPETINNRISALFIDTKQRVWIGLENGVCVYDEIFDKFNLVKSEIDITPSLINSISEDAYGNIWIAGFNGLWKVNSDLKLEKKGNSTNIKSICFNNDMVIYGNQNGLFQYDEKTDVATEIAPYFNLKNIWFLNSIKTEIYIGLKTGQIYTLNKTSNQIAEVEILKKLSHPITDIIQDDKSNIYVATDGDGIYYLDKKYKILNQFKEDVDNPYSLTSNGIYDIELGKENILWIATYGGGINYLDFNKGAFERIKHVVNNTNSIATNFSRSIAEDKNGNIWFGTTKGISIWNPKNNQWRQLPKISKFSASERDIVLALEPDNDYMWAGTYNAGLFKINVNTLNSERYTSANNPNINLEKVYAVCKDSENNLWFGGVDGFLTVIRPNNSIETYPISQIKSIIESKSGHILASGRNGVYKINHRKKEFELIEKLKPNKLELSYATINATQEYNNGNLIVGTNGSGLLFYNPETSTLKKLTIGANLPSDIVQGVLLENNNTIWASTTKGLAQIKITPNDTIINVFDKRDGTSSTEFNYGSFAKLSNNKLAFGGKDGVTIFNPDNIVATNHKPNIIFDEFKLFNKVVKPGNKILDKHIDKTDNITLKSQENSIELSFTGVLHSSSSKVKYSWKLDGFDENWSEPSTTNFATYTNLSPGEYTFKVKAYNKYETPGSERQINITILSPWWATNKAFVLYALLLIAIIYTVVHFTSVVVKKKNADEQIDFFNNITHEIKTPLTILISSLDNVTENIGTGEDSKKRIKTTVKRINSLFEQMLNFQKATSEDTQSIDISEIDLEHHLKKRINNFQPLTKERNLEIILNNNWKENYFYFDKDIFDKILLNLISNAIKYSFENGKIIINLDKTNMRELKIEVIDEGLGIPKDQQKFILKRYYRARNVINSQRPGTGLGLMMVKKLLEKTGGTIDFSSEENIGTTFTIVLKNLKFEYDKKLLSKENTINNANEIEIEDRSEIDAFSDSKILIVEDNDELRDVLVKTLGVHFQIFEASNGRQGLETAAEIFPDIILTDLIMPEMDGMQMAKQLKDDINLNHIPVFMLTVLQNSAQKLESIETGISEYIEKPVDIKFLLAKIINTLKWQKKLREKYVHDNDADNASLFRNKNDQEFLQNLEDTVIENVENESFSVHDLSASFSMSRTSLYMKLKNLVDLSPQDFIIHTKLKYAKKLLIEGECSIKEVAYRSGFSNPKYFSTSFKKFYDITPSGFLDSLKK